MEPIRIKRRARTIPFGYKQSQDPDYIEPIKEELEALRQAEDGIRDSSTSRGLGDVYKRQVNRPTRRRRDHTTL